MKDYNGYEWGWIAEDGVRQPAGTGGTCIESNIIGIWGRITREKFPVPFYHETFLKEYKSDNAEDPWKTRPLAMLMILNREQAMRAAYFETNKPSDVVFAKPKPVPVEMKRLQLWKCKECSHTFYTDADGKNIFKRAYSYIRGLITNKPERINCEACSKTLAKKVKIITKPIRG